MIRPRRKCNVLSKEFLSHLIDTRTTSYHLEMCTFPASILAHLLNVVSVIDSLSMTAIADLILVTRVLYSPMTSALRPLGTPASSPLFSSSLASRTRLPSGTIIGFLPLARGLSASLDRICAPVLRVYIHLAGTMPMTRGSLAQRGSY